MRKQPLHLRDVSISENSLEHALERAKEQGLNTHETAAMLAASGFGHSFHYPIRFYRNKDYYTPDYVVGDLVIETHTVSHLTPDVNTHNVSTVWRVENFHTRRSHYGQGTDNVVDLRNVRTGRLSRNQYVQSYYRAEITD